MGAHLTTNNSTAILSTAMPVILPLNKKHCPRCKGNGFVSLQKINARSKGQRGEREIVKSLQEQVDSIHRLYHQEPITLQRNALQAHLGGADLHGLEGFAVEVKFCENETLGSWWAQCLRQAEKLKAVPVLIYRASFQPWTVKLRLFANTPKDMDQIEMDVTVSWEDFIVWFKDAYSERFRPDIETTPHIVDTPSLVIDQSRRPGLIPFPRQDCTCVSQPGSHCPACH